MEQNEPKRAVDAVGVNEVDIHVHRSTAMEWLVFVVVGALAAGDVVLLGLGVTIWVSGG